VNINELAYPEVIIIDNIEYKGNRDIKTNTIKIPYTEEPDVGKDDIIKIKVGKREHQYKVSDCKFMKNATLQIGTNHPHILTLNVEDDFNKKETSDSPTFNINSITAGQIQVGNNNTLSVNITLKEFVDKVSNTDDEEAKTLLKKVFENPTIAGVIGAGASTLFGLL